MLASSQLPRSSGAPVPCGITKCSGTPSGSDLQSRTPSFEIALRVQQPLLSCETSVSGARTLQAVSSEDASLFSARERTNRHFRSRSFSVKGCVTSACISAQIKPDILLGWSDALWDPPSPAGLGFLLCAQSMPALLSRFAAVP